MLNTKSFIIEAKSGTLFGGERKITFIVCLLSSLSSFDDMLPTYSRKAMDLNLFRAFFRITYARRWFHSLWLMHLVRRIPVGLKKSLQV